MKNNLFLLVAGLIFLASCSTGNFAKRKYTKGKYKPERGDYNVAKNNKKKNDTKYVAKTEKNELKQSYKVNKSKTKKEKTSKQEIAENSNEEIISEPTIASNNNNEIQVEDELILTENQNLENTEVKENTEAAPNTPKSAPADVGAILGYVGFGFGLLALLVAILGFLPFFLAYGAIGLAIIGLGCSIASWIIGGKTIWNFWGVVASAVAIALSIVWAILWGVGVL